MLRAISCSSSGESVVSIQHLIYVSLCRWPFRVQVGNFLSDLHTKRSPTQSDIYHMLYWYNWFSWWWARDCSKLVENWNKYIQNNCASIRLFTKNLHQEVHTIQLNHIRIVRTAWWSIDLPQHTETCFIIWSYLLKIQPCEVCSLYK
jgi:hypothetical protein